MTHHSHFPKKSQVDFAVVDMWQYVGGQLTSCVILQKYFMFLHRHKFVYDVYDVAECFIFFSKTELVK